MIEYDGPTKTLVYFDDDLAKAKVIKYTKDDNYRLGLSYKASHDFVTNDGFVTFYWTKDDLKYMLSMIETTEGILEQEDNNE